MKLFLGCGKHPRGEGWTNLDQSPGEGVDLVFNLENCATEKLPYPDDSFEELAGDHVLEHIHNVLPMMQELHRVAKPGALLTFRLPHGASDDAWENPTHVRPYFPGSFGFFSQPMYWRESYQYTGDWKPESVKLLILPETLKLVDEEQLPEAERTLRNIVAEMIVEMSAVKPIRAMDKNLQTPLNIQFVKARRA